MPTLHCWAIVSRTASPYHAPETGVQCLQGYVSGDDRFDENANITTSQIVRAEGDYVYTKNTCYKLGDVNAEYEAQYPNARERLFSQFQGVKQ